MPPGKGHKWMRRFLSARCRHGCRLQAARPTAARLSAWRRRREGWDDRAFGRDVIAPSTFVLALGLSKCLSRCINQSETNRGPVNWNWVDYARRIALVGLWRSGNPTRERAHGPCAE